MEIPQSTDHLDATELVFSTVSMKINRRISAWDFANGQKIIDALTAFFRKHRDALGDHSFGFELAQTAGGTSPLTPHGIIKSNRNGSVLIRLDRDLNVIGSKPLGCPKDEPADEVVLSEASANTVVAHYEGKAILRFYANGFTSGRVNLDDPSSKNWSTGSKSVLR
jgi:hypothetical protein